MFIKIKQQNNSYYGAAYQGLIQGGSEEKIKEIVTIVVPELDCEIDDLLGQSPLLDPHGGRSLYFFNNSFLRTPFNKVDLSLRIETEPSENLPTARFLGLNYKYKPYHPFEILIFSKNSPSLNYALDELWIRRLNSHNSRTRSLKLPKSEALEEISYMKRRLEKFCEDRNRPNNQLYSGSPLPSPSHNLVQFSLG